MKSMLNNLERIQIVLVETQDAANIGAVCRAMKTMGITSLAIVSDKEYSIDRIKTLSLHAYDVYEQHTRCSTLEEALRDSVFTAGATRRRGKFRKYFSLLPEQLVQQISRIPVSGRISIVFGREADGLTDAELSCCDAAVIIPSSPEFPSLNLSQAVQVITYTLYRSLVPVTGHVPIDKSRLDTMTGHITEAFERIDFYKQDEKEEVRRFFRDIFARSALSEKEAARIEKMFNKMAALKIHHSAP
ncbi:MAG: TrmJ/YjtD family RNA methyltransferase [Spirochaetia bacterium]|nr:TrmJ/YjtD family RNA methyltransferase [Spirochaetia bacterium]MCF7941652.1 TrmJ/YjtD family RNA methyltransferase [Spirochaetia bacterium]